MIYIVIVLAILLLSQTGILTIFIFKARKQVQVLKGTYLFTNDINEITDIRNQFDIIIAAREDYTLIRRCLQTLNKQNFKNVYLCVDGGDINTAKLLQSEFPFYTILFNDSVLGKIQSQINCLNISTSSHVLVIDADITLLNDEIDLFLCSYLTSSSDFICPFSRGVYDRKDWLSNLAECDRTFRQRIVRAGRDAWGVSNLSGYCLLADKKKYLDVIDSKSIQDDVAATIELLKKNYQVTSYHRCVCTEIERPTLVSYLLQKTRWTAGNILLIPAYRKLFSFVPWNKAVAFSSSFLLWYWSWWIDVITFITAFFYPFLFLLLGLEGVVKYIGLKSVSTDALPIKIIPYILLWPFLTFTCLLLSPYYLIGKISDKSTRR